MTMSLTRMTASLAVALGISSVAVLGPVTAATAAPVATSVAAASAATAVPAGERNTRVSRSMTGIRSSAYVGKYYSSRYERTRKCIVRKESGGNYRIKSRSGYYRGAYQFNPYLARVTAKRMGNPKLANRSIHTWSRFHQDKAFWTVWNKGNGRGHWPTARGC